MTTAPPFFLFLPNRAPIPQHMFMNETGPCKGWDCPAPGQLGDLFSNNGIVHFDEKWCEGKICMDGATGIGEVVQKSGEVHAVAIARSLFKRRHKNLLPFRQQLGCTAEIVTPPMI